MTRYPLAFTRAWGGAVDQAAIKSTPEDFVVTELSLQEPEGEGEHVYLRIRKTGANTAWVAAQITNHCGLKPGDVSYAGRKDRNAVTTQWFSCYLPGSDPDWSGFSAEGVEVLDVTRGRRKLRRGDLAGNHFRLILRDVSDPEAVTRQLGRIAEEGFPNYFGVQRFGRDGGNLCGAHRLLVEGVRIRYERDIYISAARSYMFNLYLQRIIDSGQFSDLPEDSIGPLYGMSRDPRDGESALPDICRGWCDGLQRLRVKSGQRALREIPQQLTWQVHAGDLEVSFELGAGSYATSLLREAVDMIEPGGESTIEQA